MDLTNVDDRRSKGRELKIKFQYLMNETLQSISADSFSYMDMKLISDSMNNEIPKLIGLKELPPQVKAGLEFATASLNPNTERRIKELKNAISLCVGVGGATTVWISLGILLNPSMWAIIVAFFCGGIAGGPLSVVGITAGIGLVAAAVYSSMSKKTPSERVAKCIEMVEKSIDEWVKKGCKDVIALQ